VDNSENPPIRVVGRVKWFDPVKGFGFVVAETGGPDILLHANVLRNFGQSSISDTVHIVLMAQSTARGVQAVEVLEITADETISTTPWVEVSDPSQVDGVLSALQPARVKWFDQAKGFGFANLFGNSADVFLHIEVLRRSGLTDLQPGEALALRTVSGKRGLMATDVKPWESAVEH
jgi:CspA family cold shock protein